MMETPRCMDCPRDVSAEQSVSDDRVVLLVTTLRS